MTLEPATAYRILHRGLSVGHIFAAPERNLRLRDLQQRWDTKNAFVEWKLPARFDYLWVDEVWVHHEYRRKGIAARALRRLIRSQPRPTLIALGPGDIDLKNPVGYEAVISFYTSLGFYFQKFGPLCYAFHWTQGKS